MKNEPNMSFETMASQIEALQQQPCFIDFEASSLDLICSYPIEVGVCLPDGAIHSWLLRPAPLWTDWSEDACAIHGISRQQLQQEGVNVVDVAHALNELLPEHVYCDAWTFDSFWLHRLFRAAKLQPAFKLESIAALLAPQQVNNWAETRRRAIETLGVETHRAANDAQILYTTWKMVIEQGL